MHDVLETFVEDLRQSKFATVADALSEALNAMDIEADYNAHATVFLEAITWVVAHTGRSLEERFRALDKLSRHNGSEIELHQFCGWFE